MRCSGIAHMILLFVLGYIQETLENGQKSISRRGKSVCDLFLKTSKKQASKHGGKSPLAGLVFCCCLLMPTLLIAQHQLFERPAASNPFSHDSAKFKFYSQNKFAAIGYRAQTLYTRPSYVSRIQGLISNHPEEKHNLQGFWIQQSTRFCFFN